MRATVITDASYCPDTGAAGWAAWITLDSGKRLKNGATIKVPVANSTEAELFASLNGIRAAQNFGATVVLLQTDCLSVVEILGDPNNIKNQSARRQAGVTVAVTTRHVKGHTQVDDARSWVNRWCDREAKKYMRIGRNKARKDAGNRWAKGKG